MERPNCKDDHRIIDAITELKEAVCFRQLRKNIKLMTVSVMLGDEKEVIEDKMVLLLEVQALMRFLEELDDIN